MKKLIFYPFYLYAMKIYHRDKDYEKAMGFYKQAEKFFPNHTENLFKIGMCYKKMRNYREASEYFDRALKLDLENEKYQKELQIANARDYALFAPTKLWWQEIIVLEQEIKDKGEKYELLCNLAEDCLAMRHYDKAAKAYKRAIALCKEKDRLPQLYYEMGYAYENIADEAHLQLAKEAYAQAINLDEELESKRYGIGVFHFAKERWRFANRAFLKRVESLSQCHCVSHTCDSAIASLQGVSEANEEANQIQAQSGISINCHCEARSHEAIHNTESHLKDSIAKTSLCNIIDCHENQRFSRNDAEASISESCKDANPNQSAFNDVGADALVFRHCEDARTKQSITLHTKDSTTESQKSDIMDCHENQRFSRNDVGADASDSRHCEQSEAIHNQAYFKDSIAKSRVDKMIDCHENQRFSRNDAEASISESCKDANLNQSAFNDVGADASDSCHCERSEAIHNQAYFKDSIAKSRVDKMIDCHENQRFSRNDVGADASESCKDANHHRFSRNDVGADALVFRHCEDARTKQSITLHTKDSTIESQKSDIMDCHENQRFSRNDVGADASDSCHCEQSEAIHNQAYFKDSIAKSRVDKMIDCHENQRFSRNDTEASISESRKDAEPIIACTDDLLLKKVGESFEWLYDWENALKYYQQSLRVNYQNPQTHFRLGFVYERIGDYQQAAESYTQGLQRNNDLNPYWVYRLGFCLNQLGEFQEASKILLNLRTTDAYPLIVGGGGELQDDKCLEE